MDQATKIKFAELRHRLQLRRQAEDAAAAAGAQITNPRGRAITAVEKAAMLAVADLPPPAHEIDPDLADALRAYAEAQRNTPADEELIQLFGGLGRVARFCREVGITLVHEQASIEATRFANLTVSQRHITLWFDCSRHNGKFAQEAAINSYLQAMRTALSRLRRRIRLSGSKRLMRQFGISLSMLDEIEHCPGLFRVVIDSRADKNQDKVALAFSEASLSALTIETPVSMLAPSLLEQQIAARARGIKNEE